MTTVTGLTDVHVVLLAVQLTSDGELQELSKLVHLRRDVLLDTLLYRLLISFYPAEVPDQSSLVHFLRSLRDLTNEPKRSDALKVDPSISTLPREDAVRQCRALKLRPIPQHAAINTESELANFVIEFAKRLETLSGAAGPPADFVEQFIEEDPDLRLWYETYLVPVVRLQYEFYPDVEDVIGVRDIEGISGANGVKTLLQYAEKQHSATAVARDLDRVVGPWVRGGSRAKRRKIDKPLGDVVDTEASWESVNNWLLSSSLADFDVSAKAYVEWGGPEELGNEIVARFAQTGLAIIYGCSQASIESQTISRQILNKVTSITRLDHPNLSISEPDISLSSTFERDLEETDLMSNSLLRRSNRFTKATESTVQLLIGLLCTADILLDLGLPWTICDLARACIFGSERRHKDEFRRLLRQIPRQTRKEIDWHSVRRQLLWLRSWTHGQQSDLEQHQPAFLSRLSLTYVETQVLDALLRAAQYNVVKNVYLNTSSPPLSVAEVENRVVAAILEAYDNSSNGNRDRGGMKRASEILKAFQPNFQQSSSLSDIDYLIRATHSLSFYQLTLQHGVPFKPVAIRVQKDPLTLVGKVLEQDAKAYTKLDDLLEIGRNLTRAHLPSRTNLGADSDPLDLRLFDAEHKITYLAVMAALAANDFDTAYAYITTRLSNSTAQASTSGFTDDTSWRAAYAAGKHRPSSSPKSLAARINSLAQRMELLSRALLLAPAGEALSGILATWRRYEEEMDALKTEAVEEERAFDAKADASLPGAFGLEDRDADAAETKSALARRNAPSSLSSPSYEDEAPLGLFDVARGAATALRKSAAFPLGSSGLRDLKIHSTTPSREVHTEQVDISDSGEQGRVRKRDMVTNMVTSGLVSGMGWVLGAQPRDRVDYGAERSPG